jgi:hypothetical protein
MESCQPIKRLKDKKKKHSRQNSSGEFLAIPFETKSSISLLETSYNIQHRGEYEYSSKPERTGTITLNECSQSVRQASRQTQASQPSGWEDGCRELLCDRRTFKPTSTLMMTILQYHMTLRSYTLTGNINRIYIPSEHQCLAQIQLNPDITTSIYATPRLKRQISRTTVNPNSTLLGDNNTRL